eukprot:TRINITY_DN7218_c0_g1_i1.p2 TRINITY_DN7218_c0_g1~~TRINITY_DN7218_c0_g1_i1.p2  ORF type:complete len:125 (-),score=20.83 TRINITY_DN7218_c0_g1_i1:184-558(-)
MASFSMKPSSLTYRKVNKSLAFSAPRPRVLRTTRTNLLRVGAVEKEEIQSKVISIISEHLSSDPQTVAPESVFVDDLGADSLDIVEIMMALEEEFKVDFPDDGSLEITKVGEVVDYIMKKKEES